MEAEICDIDMTWAYSLLLNITYLSPSKKMEAEICSIAMACTYLLF